MRLYRSTLLAGVALAVLPVTAASAATGTTTAGSATSTATLATVSVGSLVAGATTLAGHTVSIGTLTAGAQTLSPSTAPSVTFTPLTVDGAAPAGSVTVTPATSPKTVGAVSTGALPLNVLSATSPSATLTAASTTAARNASLTTSLGSAHILGLPVTLTGGLDVGSVTDAAHAQAGKSLTITNVSLPNLADLLAALGLDLTKLPAATLNGLVTQLPVAVTGTQQAAMDAANTAIDTAQTNLTAAQGDVTTAAADLATATSDLDTALAPADLTGVTLPSGVTAPLDHTDWDQLDSTTKTAIETLNVGLAATAAAYDAATTALATANAALTAATAALAAAIATLGGLVSGVLAGTPLVSIDAAEISTKALVGATKAAAVTGSISGVKVLGQDVLSAVTGNSTLDAAALVGTVATQVNSAIGSLTATLSSVLSSATGAVGLVVPAPSIKLMVKQATTGTDGVFGVANATLTAIDISMGSVTLPTAYALDTATNLAGIAPISTGFKTAPLAVKVATLVEAARYSKNAPASGSGLPATGLPAGLGIVALAGTGLALVARRRLRADQG